MREALGKRRKVGAWGDDLRARVECGPGDGQTGESGGILLNSIIPEQANEQWDLSGLAEGSALEYQVYQDGRLPQIQSSTGQSALSATIPSQLFKLRGMESPVPDAGLDLAGIPLLAKHFLSRTGVHTRMSRLGPQELYFQNYVPSKDILQAIKAIGGPALQKQPQDLLRSRI